MVKGKRIHTRKWQRCVRKVKRKGKVKSPEAVCTKKLGRKSYLKKPIRRKI